MQTTLATHTAHEIKNSIHAAETVNTNTVPLNSTVIPLDVISVARR